MERYDVPCLFIESDMMDKRVVAEAQLKNRIDAFFEGWPATQRAEPEGNHGCAAIGSTQMGSSSTRTSGS
jgi:hypothetical protein